MHSMQRRKRRKAYPLRPCGRCGARGQTLVIFAISATVLIALAGLAIDAARAVDLYARMERAAEAGALAGALYMPNYYDTVRPGDSESAILARLGGGRQERLRHRPRHERCRLPEPGELDRGGDLPRHGTDE